MADFPIPAEARGAVRALKAKLRRADARFNQRFESLEANRAASRWAKAGSLGRLRALRDLRRLFGPTDRHVSGYQSGSLDQQVVGHVSARLRAYSGGQ